MARVLPDGWRALAETGAAQRRVATLERLAHELDAAYTVYHGVHWTQVEGSQSVFGEIDFVVVNRAGDLLLIQQLPGLLEETPDGLMKRHPGRSLSVPAQMARQVQALRAKLAARGDCPSIHIDYLLFCPDFRVRQPQVAGLAPERIVDSARKQDLPALVAELLPPGESAPAATAVHRFLRDLIQLETDVSTLIGRVDEIVTRISGGLAHWARQLEFEPFRLRVTGTAGSGKSQLALAEYRAALAAGKRPLYLCFNRPLADHIARIVPPAGLACTFHHLCDRQLRAAGRSPDFSRADRFERLVAEAAALPASEQFDAVIVDEGQDFLPAWRDQILRLAAPGARLLWLEDPLQNLYATPRTELPGWVQLHARSNYRSPRAVTRMLQTLLPDSDIEAASPIETGAIGFHVYEDKEGLLQGIKDAIRDCYGAGFRHEDVVLLSFHGRDQSALTGLEQIGPHRLRRFAGSYDLLGEPVYTPGDVLQESVYRFKGQCAPAVVLAEMDFAKLDGRALRKLFVGATRASMKLRLVLSAAAAKELTNAGIDLANA